MDTIPERLFDIMATVDLGTDNTIQVTIDDGDLETAREVLSDAYTGFVTFQRTGNTVTVEVVAEHTEQMDQEVMEEELPPREPVLDMVDIVGIEAEGAGEQVQDAPMVENAIPMEQIPHNEMIGPIEITENRVNDNNQVYAVIAQAVGDESINIAKQLKDALVKFDHHFSKAVALKRQVEEATRQFSENSPAIINLVEQASVLAENYELVDSVYFTETELVFITTTLITDDRWDGHRRLIGSMRIGIKLESLFSPNPTGHDHTISIKNLTHRYSTSSGRIWECGHIDTYGGTCFGTAFDAIFDAIVSRDLTYIIESLIRFIKTPNPNDSWGSHLKYWPIAPVEHPADQDGQQ